MDLLGDCAVASVTARMDRLERELRWWQLVGVATLAILGWGLVIGATREQVADEIRVKRLLIVDDSGRSRAVLGTEGNAPALRLYDARGTNRAEILLRADGVPFVALRDDEAKTTAQLDVGPDLRGGFQGGFLLLGSRRGIGVPRHELVAGFSDHGQPYIRFLDKESKVIWKAP